MKDEVRERLADLREVVEQARSMPMSASAVVNRAEVLGLIEEAGQALEKAFTEATGVVDDRAAVVASGQVEADEILHQARIESDRLVSDSHVYQLAQERAQEIEAAARREAEELRAETERYVEDRLANFELTLDRTLEVVRRGRARIQEGVGHGFGPDTDEGELPEHLRR